MEAVRISYNRQHSFRGCNGPVLRSWRVLIPWGPDQFPNIFVIKPTVVPCDEMPPMIVRVATELREQLRTQIETNMFQLTCERVENLPERFQCLTDRRHMSANPLRGD
jgi:hypothetical protein